MKKPKTFKPLFPALFALLLAAFFASCATAPKTSFPAEDGNAFSLLPSGGKMYLWADTVKARPLLDVLSFDGKSGRDAAAILDRTESAVAAVFPEGWGRRFYLAAAGDYPRGKANLSFAFSRAWKKQKSQTGNSFWFSKNDNIALALGKSLALVSDVDPFGAVSGGIPPEGFADFRRGFVLAGWLSDSSESVNGFLANLGLPIQIQIPAEELFFGAVKMPAGTDGGLWELSFKIKTPSENNAASLLGVISFARRFFAQGEITPRTNGREVPMSPMEAAALFFANAPEQDGKFLSFRVSSLDEAGIALLFDMFSVYSSK